MEMTVIQPNYQSEVLKLFAKNQQKMIKRSNDTHAMVRISFENGNTASPRLHRDMRHVTRLMGSPRCSVTCITFIFSVGTLWNRYCRNIFYSRDFVFDWSAKETYFRINNDQARKNSRFAQRQGFKLGLLHSAIHCHDSSLYGVHPTIKQKIFERDLSREWICMRTLL